VSQSCYRLDRSAQSELINLHSRPHARCEKKAGVAAVVHVCKRM